MKPWDVTDDDVANGLVPDAPTDGQDDPDGGFDAALVDDESEEMDDPWSAGLEASAASVAPARPLSPAGACGTGGPDPLPAARSGRGAGGSGGAGRRGGVCPVRTWRGGRRCGVCV